MSMLNLSTKETLVKYVRQERQLGSEVGVLANASDSSSFFEAVSTTYVLYVLNDDET